MHKSDKVLDLFEKVKPLVWKLYKKHPAVVWGRAEFLDSGMSVMLRLLHSEFSEELEWTKFARRFKKELELRFLEEEKMLVAKSKKIEQKLVEEREQILETAQRVINKHQNFGTFG